MLATYSVNSASGCAMSDENLQDVEYWLLTQMKEREGATADDLISLGHEQPEKFSPSAITWALWYLVSGGQLHVTRDNVVTAR